MSTRRVTTVSNKELLWALATLTVAFIILQFSYLCQQLNSILFQINFKTNYLLLAQQILPYVGYFLGVFLIIHIFYVICMWLITLGMLDTMSGIKKNSLTIAIINWFIGILFILMANAMSYPNSSYTQLIRQYFPSGLIAPLYYILLALMLSMVLLASGAIIKRIMRYPLITGLAAMFIAANTYLVMTLLDQPVIVHDAATSIRPNIIVIGIDSLRPDFLGYFGAQQATPFIDRFLRESSVFSDAVTPSARTYPAWVSILTGKHPVVTGARSDLERFEDVRYTHSLPATLRNIGYQTVYATDESRFSNIDEQYDFDTVVMPPIGVLDFVIGTTNDFPFSNLLVRTHLGKWLFPYNYANRSSYYNYDPNSFLRQLDDSLPSNRQQPLFLAIHFCLPHTPYIWGGFNTANLKVIEWYSASIQRTDRQLEDFFSMMDKKDILKHAIVVLLSDHGESLELSGDRATEKDLFLNHDKPIPHFYPSSQANEEVNQSGGHGTDVLGLPQYHSLLAFKLYGTGFQQIGVIPGVVSLMDIKPTLIDIMKIKHRLKAALNDREGTSLARLVQGETHQVPMRHIFIESDYSPPAIRTSNPKISDVLLEGIRIYEINPHTARLHLKPSMRPVILQSKQYADIYDHWMLATYPQPDNQRISILVDLLTGQWTNNLNSTFANESPAKEMMQKLQHFYNA